MTKKERTKEIKLLKQLKEFYLSIPYDKRDEECHEVLNRIEIRLFYMEEVHNMEVK